MHEIELIMKFFPSTEGLTIFDVGACNFSDSLKFKNQFPTSKVFAFEPDVDNLRNYQSSAESSGVNVVPTAVSDKDSEMTFYPSETLNAIQWKFSGSVKKPRTIGDSTEGINHKGLHFNLQGYSVQSVRLDTFCRLNDITNIDYLHIDVQGAEYEVVSSLGSLRPKVIFAETCEFDTYETDTTIEKFDNLMETLGYSLHSRLQYDNIYIHGAK